MKMYINIKSLSLLFIILFTINAWADYNPFSNVKNARELTKQANEQHYQVRFRRLPARNILDFDKIANMHVSGRRVYADWYYYFRMQNYVGKGISEVERDLKDSNIKIKIVWTPNPSITAYNTIYKQSINPGREIRGRETTPIVQSTAPKSPVYKGFTKPKLIQGGSNASPSWGHYETINGSKVFVQGSSNTSSYTSTNNGTPYDSEGNVLLTLYVYKYSGKVTKMPSLTGLTLIDARAKLTSLKIPIGYIQEIYEETTNPALYGKIFEQTIKADTAIVKPEMMGLKIYSMPKFKMPDLTKGWNLKKAQENKYFVISHTYTEILDTQSAGNLDGAIYEQDVKPGTTLFRPTNVKVKVYKIIKCAYPPDVKNLTIKDAIAKLESAGFKPKIIDIDALDYIKAHQSVYKVNTGYVLTENISCLAPGSVVEIGQIKLKETILPNFENKKCDAINAEIEKLKTKLGKIYFTFKEVENTSYKEGNVIVASNPTWGSTIETFQNITISCRKTIYLPKIRDDEAYIPPDIKGKTEAVARAELESLGFTSISVKKEKQVGAVDGTVLDVWGQMDNSTIGYARYKEERLTLLVADINGAEMPIMPSILGSTPEIAKSILLEKGFKDIRFESEASSFVKHVTSLPDGTVIATSPRGGAKCQYGFDSTIFLTVKLKPNQQLPSNVNNTEAVESDTVTVPSLDLTVDGTIKKIKEAGLIPEVLYETTKYSHFSGKIKPGSDPAWQTIVKKGSTVTFSAYVFSPVVPSVVAISKETAISIIRKNSFKEKINYFITDNKNLEGTVKSQSPKSGEKAEVNSIIDITVYKYSNMVTVPRLEGTSESSAINILEKYVKNLEYKVVYADTVLTTLVGKVKETLPPSNTKVSEGSTVTLYVYKMLEKIPSVVGKSEQEAVSLLEELGFGISKVYSTEHKAGLVWFQHPEANSAPTHAGITISVGKSSAPSPTVNKSIRLSKLSSEDNLKIQDFYKSFKEAYESKDEGQVARMLSDDWESGSGGDITDLENNLNRVFSVFDEINYNISNLNIQSSGNNEYRVSYDVNIVGEIYDEDIIHEEKSSVTEVVRIENDKVKILKTINGMFWSIK